MILHRRPHSAEHRSRDYTAAMNPKPQPNRRRYIEVLRGMTPEQRLLKALELGEFSRELFRTGLKERFPELTDSQLQALYVKRLAKCHNRNY